MKRFLSVILTVAIMLNPIIAFADAVRAAALSNDPIITILEESTERKIVITSDSDVSDLDLYVSAYKDNRLIKTIVEKNIDLAVGENIFDIEPTWVSADRNRVKIFLLDSNLSPVAEDVTIFPPAIRVENVYVNEDDGTAEVDISIENNPGISALKMNVEYDDSLKLVDLVFNENYGDMVTAPEPFENPQSISFISPFGNNEISDVFVTLKFDVSAFSADMSYTDIKVTYDNENTFNENGEPVNFEVSNGKIFFNEVEPVSRGLLMSEESETMVLSVSEKSGVVGETVDVEIDLTNNPGLSSFKFKVEYDEYLELTNVVLNTEDFGNRFAEISSYSNPQTISWLSSLENVITEGNVATLTFRISEEAPDGYEAAVSISYNEDDIFDVNKNNVDTAIVNSIVTVYHSLPGDINSDGIVTLWDAILHFRYLADIDVDIDTLSLDVTGDGKVNNKDSVDIFRYVAGWSNIVLKRGCYHVLTAVAMKAATCTEDGYNAYWLCDNCGKMFSDDMCVNRITQPVVIPALGHSFDVNYDYDELYHWRKATCEHSNLVEDKELHTIINNKCTVCTLTYHSITYYNLKGTVEDLQLPTIYSEKDGLELPNISCEGYEFLGWYDNNNPDNRIWAISPGSTADYTLVAKWDFQEYDITYLEAPSFETGSYTMEDEYILPNPKWPGMEFLGWTDENGEEITSIKKGTTGNLTLTANWDNYRNKVVPAEGDRKLYTVKGEKEGVYYFVYKIGTIEHVVLEDRVVNDTSLIYLNGINDFNLSISSTKTISSQIAETISDTILQSVSSSTGWSECWEWTEFVSKSKKSSKNAKIGIKIPAEVPISASIGGSYSEESVTGSEDTTATSNNGSDAYGNEISESQSSTFAYSTTLSEAVTKEYLLPRTLPAGYYHLARCGNIIVYALIKYDASTEEISMDTYSELVNKHETTIYYKDVNELNDNSWDSLSFEIPKAEILSVIDSSYYVKYDPNGATSEGEMPLSVHGVNEDSKLLPNEYKKAGYTFSGWELRDENGNSIATYSDEGKINNITEGGNTVTLYAKWTLTPYKVSWDTPENATITVKRTYSPYDDDVKPVDLSNNSTIYYGEELEITYAASDGYHIIPNGKGDEKITVGGDVTSKQIYVTTNANTYTVTYNANGGSDTTLQTTHTYGVSSALRSNGFSRSNYTFLGWSTSATATTPAYKDCESVKNLTTINNGNVILYAVWVKTYGSAALGNGTEVDIQHNPNYTLNYNVSLNKANLKANGYSKLQIKVNFEAWEGWAFHSSKPVVSICYSDGTVYTTKTGEMLNHSSIEQRDTIVFETSVDVLSNSGAIKVMYNGIQCDNNGVTTDGAQKGWKIRNSEVHVTAIK